MVIVLLTASLADAQNSEIVMPMKDGLAEGTSIYSRLDGTQVLTDWHEGQKHGSYRMVTSAGLVLREGSYEHGRRRGMWTSRDEAGNILATGAYVLGLRHGTHKRFEIASEGRTRLVESSPYVLGLKHGRGKFKDARTGLVLEGNFQWNQRHGRFVASKAGKALERVFVCDKPTGEVVDLRSLPQLQRCKASAPIHLPKLAKAFAGKRSARALQKTLCASRDTLRIPVFVGGKPLPCLKPLAAATESETFGTLVHSFLKADTVVDGFAYEFRNSNVTTARFAQTIVPGNPSRTSQSGGQVQLYKQGRAAWTFRSRRYCEFVTSGTFGKTVGNGKPPMVASYGDILEWITVFAYSKAAVSDFYEARLAGSSAADVAVVLTPKKTHDVLESITLDVGNNRYQGIVVAQSTVRLHNGTRIVTKFKGLRSSVLPMPHEDDIVPPRVGHTPRVRCR